MPGEAPSVETVVDDPLRDRLINAAIEVFGECGYDGAGVQQIARAAGLTTGAIYSRFRGKDDLLLEAIDAIVPQEIERLLAGQVNDNAVDIIAQLGSYLVDEQAESSILLEAIVASRREPALSSQLDKRLDEDFMRLGKLIEEAKAAGLVDAKYDTQALTTFCSSVSLGMLVHRSLGREMPSHDDWNALIGDLITALLPEPLAPTTHVSPVSAGGTVN